MKTQKYFYCFILLAILFLAGCSSKTYTVSFDVQGAQEEIETITAKEGSVIKKPLDPQKTGYQFLYWQEKESEQSFDFATPITKDIDLEAKWITNIYSINYFLDGGEFEPFETKQSLSEEFFKDLLSFFKIDDDKQSFIHGFNKSEGYDGLWLNDSNYNKKIFPEEPLIEDDQYFFSSRLYYQKWLPLNIMIDDFIEMGSESALLATEINFKLRALFYYFSDTLPNPEWPLEALDMMPESAIVTSKFEIESKAINLVNPIKPKHHFLGWFNDQDYQLEVEKISSGTFGSQNIYAKWERIYETSTKPRYYPTNFHFQMSLATSEYQEYSEKIVYNKSFPIPGMEKTYYDGAIITTMVPQAITYVNGYFLISAYDSNKKVNSVIYLISEESGFLRTIILPNDAHVGGLAYDGKNIWVSGKDKTIHTFKAEVITDALTQEEESFFLTEYLQDYQVENTPSFLSYYNDIIYVGTFTVSDPSLMSAYQIQEKASTPIINKVYDIVIPNRSQGAFFTDTGLLISRSYSRNNTTPNYISQLEYYQINISKNLNQSPLEIEEPTKVLILPPMAEGIILVDAYFYVVFESCATLYQDATHITDRVVAFAIEDFY